MPRRDTYRALASLLKHALMRPELCANRNAVRANALGPFHAEVIVGDFRSQRLLSNMTASTRTSPHPSCWKCGQGVSCSHGLFCEGCGTVQPPAAVPTNAYALLVDSAGLEPGQESTDSGQALKFDINMRELERRYKDLQRVLHPDKFSTASPAEKEYSAEQAIRVNMAYAALKDPLSRADCLLSLAGVEEEEGKTIGALPHHSDMLMTFMEWREEIEDAKDETTLIELRDKIRNKIDECMDKLKVSFDDARDINGAKEGVQELRYLMRMQDAILDKL